MQSLHHYIQHEATMTHQVQTKTSKNNFLLGESFNRRYAKGRQQYTLMPQLTKSQTWTSNSCAAGQLATAQRQLLLSAPMQPGAGIASQSHSAASMHYRVDRNGGNAMQCNGPSKYHGLRATTVAFMRTLTLTQALNFPRQPQPQPSS